MKALDILYSWKTTLILLLLYGTGLASATFVENAYSTETARDLIYNNYLFYMLQGLLVLNFIGIARRSMLRRKKRYTVLFLHIAFIFILIGAFITRQTGVEGVVHIREGESASFMQTHTGRVALPFSIRLEAFRLVRYPGSQSPSSFESDLVLVSNGVERPELIYMNKVLYEQGYRIYQSSYDADEQGTILTVNKDFWGTTVTYAGYFMLFAAMIGLFFDRGSRFRQLNKKLRMLAPLFFCLLISYPLPAQENTEKNLRQNTIPPELARKWGRLVVQCPTGRIEPVNTYSSKLLRKVYGSDRFHGLSSEQVVQGFIMNPGYWGNVLLIRQKNKELANELSLPGEYISFYDLFHSDGTYKLARRVEEVYTKPPAVRSKKDKDLLKLDERVNILYALQQGTLFALFPLPGDDSARWYSYGDELDLFTGRDSLFVSSTMPWYIYESYQALSTNEWQEASGIIDMISIFQRKQSTVVLPSDTQISWELFYNRSRIFFWSAIAYVMLGLALLTFSLIRLLQGKSMSRLAVILIILPICLVFIGHSAGIGIRWYISGQAPWSNAYESMIYVSWSAALVGLFFSRRSILTLALASFLAGIILFVANLNGMDPEITPLVPVLKSYWLMIHVAVITASYGFFGVSFLLGVISLMMMALKRKSALLHQKIKELRIINEMSLIIGLCLLSAGTFLGAIWANESWGRYWGWDPKETWALITMVVYALILHARFVPSLRSDYAFSVMSVYGLTSVLMTYFGVNYYLTGLHSYGGGDLPAGLNMVYIIYTLLTLLTIYAGYIHRKKVEPV